MARLYRKYRAFVEEYFRQNMNGTRAYKNVYGVKDDEVAAASASRLLGKDKVAQYIEERLIENQMGANEALARLREQARNPAAEYLDDDGRFDFARAREDGMLHLVKSVSISESEKATSLKVELVDPQAALITIAKHHKLLGDGSLNLILNVEGLENLLDRIYGSPDDQGG